MPGQSHPSLFAIEQEERMKKQSMKIKIVKIDFFIKTINITIFITYYGFFHHHRPLCFIFKKHFL